MRLRKRDFAGNQELGRNRLTEKDIEEQGESRGTGVKNNWRRKR